jgi:predicted NAD/FAD-dependent oxidoreductase
VVNSKNGEREPVEVLVVGAGMAGLIAAAEMRERGAAVQVIEKRPTVGGRLAGRRIGPATFDCGAQFMTARDARFVAAITRWQERGVVTEWHRGEGKSSAGHPRWRGVPTMAAIAEHLARNLAVFLGKGVVGLRRRTAGWEALLADGTSVTARALLLTPPAPRSLALLDASGIALSPGRRSRLEGVAYDPCLAVMAALDGPPQVPPPGGLGLSSGPLSWIADNQIKGVSTVPAVTLHATPAYSLEHWEEDRRESGRALLRAAAPWLGAEVVAFEVQGWRYARGPRVEESGCLMVHESPPLVLAGDAFGGPRVEGAAISGWAAADALRHMGSST